MSVSLHNPYALPAGGGRRAKKAQWLKGNLHMHTTESDGSRAPQVAVDDFAARGYDFIMISDHDKVTPPTMVNHRGMVLIPGNEVSARGPHLLHVNAGKRIEPELDRQKVIDAIEADGGFAVMNHPNWSRDYNHCPLPVLKRLQGYAGIEIFNGGADLALGSGVATDKWDAVLSAGRIVWCYANDDSHHDEEVGRGWNMVLTADRTAAGIVAALRAGRCYASTGVTIQSIEVKGAKVTVKTANADRIDVVTAFSQIQHTVNGRNLTFDASELPYGFLRIECFGPHGTKAWTQPFAVRGGQAGRRAKLLAQRQVLNVTRVPRLPAMGLAPTAAPWKGSLVHGQFRDLFTADPAPIQTRVQCLSDGKSIRFLIDCDEPQMDQVKTQVTAHNDPSTWADDSVEIFLDPTGELVGHWQIMINAAGWCCPLFDRKGAELKQFRTRAVRSAHGWRVEFEAPLKSLGVAPDLKGARINIGRTRLAEGRRRRTNTSWKWLGETFHVPEQFGELRFRR